MNGSSSAASSLKHRLNRVAVHVLKKPAIHLTGSASEFAWACGAAARYPAAPIAIRWVGLWPQQSLQQPCAIGFVCMLADPVPP